MNFLRTSDALRNNTISNSIPHETMSRNQLTKKSQQLKPLTLTYHKGCHIWRVSDRSWDKLAFRNLVFLLGLLFSAFSLIQDKQHCLAALSTLLWPTCSGRAHHTGLWAILWHRKRLLKGSDTPLFTSHQLHGLNSLFLEVKGNSMLTSWQCFPSKAGGYNKLLN